MPKFLKYSLTIFLSLMFIVLFTAFGCKKSEEKGTNETSSNASQPTEEVTYDQKKEEQADNSSENKAGNENSVNRGNTATNEGSDSTKSDSSKKEESDKLLLEQASKLAEIYGTFTNTDKEAYKNLKDLKQYSTEKLQKWIDEKSKTPVNPNVPFYGVITKALSSVILEKSDTKSKILITAKREEITSTSNTPKVSYKILLMLFEKAGEEWKLSGIYWQE